MILLKQLKYYLKTKKHLILFISILALAGAIVGLYLGVSNIEFLKEDVLYYTSHIKDQSYNYILFHFFAVVISIVTSFFAIGIPLLCTLLFYEGMSVGFLIGIFSVTYGISGTLFVLLFLIVTKLVYFVILIFLFSKCLKIARKMIGKYIYKTDPSIIVGHLLKGCICLTGMLLIYDGFLYLFGSKIITLLSFLL